MRGQFAKLLLALAAVVAACPPSAEGQELNMLRSGANRVRATAPPVGADAGEPSRLRSALDRMPLWSAPLASAVMPGLGQARLHKDRFVAFMAAEAFLLLQYNKSTSDARENATNFREIARDVARRRFPGTHPDTSAWKYYETMEKYLESGAYSLPSNGSTVPETDASTYNGAQWVQARVLFGVPLDDPDARLHPNYARALARYETNAVQPAYGWSWRNAQLEQDLYKRTIASSNAAYRRATGDLIALIANHVISAVDAFATVRLVQAGNGDMRMSASIPVP